MTFKHLLVNTVRSVMYPIAFVILCFTRISLNLSLTLLTYLAIHILDLLLTDNNLVSEVLVHQYDTYALQSDHLPITFLFMVRNSKRCQLLTVVFVYPKAASDYDFSCCFESYDVEEVWSAIKLLVTSAMAMDLFIPKVRIKTYQHPRWTTPQLRHQVNCLKTLGKCCAE